MTTGLTPSTQARWWSTPPQRRRLSRRPGAGGHPLGSPVQHWYDANSGSLRRHSRRPASCWQRPLHEQVDNPGYRELRRSHSSAVKPGTSKLRLALGPQPRRCVQRHHQHRGPDNVDRGEHDRPTADVGGQRAVLNRPCPWLVFTATSGLHLKIVSQALNGFPANESATLPYPPLAGSGNSLSFTSDKIVHNNGPYGPVNALVSPVATVTNLVGGLLAGDCVVTPPSASLPLISLAASVSTPVAEPFTLTCTNPATGMGEDTDGDGLIDEDRIDGVDNDGDTLVDEDSGYLLPTVCIGQLIAVIRSRQRPEPGERHYAALHLPDGPVQAHFTPSFTVMQDEGQAPGRAGDLTAHSPGPRGTATSRRRLCVGPPCEQLMEYAISPGSHWENIVTIAAGRTTGSQMARSCPTATVDQSRS